MLMLYGIEPYNSQPTICYHIAFWSVWIISIWISIYS